MGESPWYWEVIIEIVRETKKVRFGKIAQVIKKQSPEDEEAEIFFNKRRAARKGPVKISDPWENHGSFPKVEDALAVIEKIRAQGHDMAFIRTADGQDTFFHDIGRWRSEVEEERDLMIKSWIEKLEVAGNPKTWEGVQQAIGVVPDEYVGFQRMGTQSWHARHECIALCLSRGRVVYTIPYSNKGMDPTMDPRLVKEWEESWESFNEFAANYYSHRRVAGHVLSD